MKAIRMEAVVDSTATSYKLFIGGDGDNVYMVLRGPDPAVQTSGGKTYLVKAASTTPTNIVKRDDATLEAYIVGNP